MSEGDDATPVVRRAQDDVLADLAHLHQQFDDEQVSFDDFESANSQLLAQLAVE